MEYFESNDLFKTADHTQHECSCLTTAGINGTEIYAEHYSQKEWLLTADICLNIFTLKTLENTVKISSPDLRWKSL